jgi:3-oxoacyl-[acyl-carrier-protein] synthase-3
MTSKIIGVGNYVPLEVIDSVFFNENIFFDENGKKLEQNNAVIAEKLKEITGIEERRYASKELVFRSRTYCGKSCDRKC